MGEYDEEWGATFWAHVEEQAMPVKFTKQIKYIPAIGSKIVAEEHEVKQGKKEQYTQLKKVKLEDTGKNQPTQTATSAPDANFSTPPSDVMKALEIIMADVSEIKQRVIALEGGIEEATANEIFPDEA